MAADIKTMTRKELEKLKGQIEKQLEKLEVQDKKAAREAAEKAAKAHGFSLNELTEGKPAPKTRAKRGTAKSAKSVNPPKYRNPANPSQTWTGKGRRPEWIKAAQEKGTDIETMAI